jgi:hypothetical protein
MNDNTETAPGTESKPVSPFFLKARRPGKAPVPTRIADKRDETIAWFPGSETAAETAVTGR